MFITFGSTFSGFIIELYNLCCARTGAKVHAEILEHFRDEKVIIFKMKAKKHYRRKTVRQLRETFLLCDPGLAHSKVTPASC